MKVHFPSQADATNIEIVSFTLLKPLLFRLKLMIGLFKFVKSKYGDSK
jgi:hypothetical protein